MFNPHVIRRSFSSFSKLSHPRLIRSAARDGAESIIIQRVNIRKPFWSRSRRFAIFFSVALAGFTTSGLALSSPEHKNDADRRRNPNLSQQTGRKGKKEPGRGFVDPERNDDEEEEEEEDEDDDDVLLFLPTGFSRPKPRTYYRGSDPEWKEFVRIAPDRKRMERARDELVTTVRDAAAKNPGWRQRLGKINPNAGAVWMEHSFPDGPPIEYERPGVELTEDLQWRKTTRPVDEIHHLRLDNVLIPSAVAGPLYNDWRRRAGDSWNGFKSYMGWGGKPDTLSAQTLIQVPPRKSMSLPRPPHPPSAPSSKNATGSSTPAATDTRQSQDPSSPSSQLDESASARSGIVLPDVRSLTIDLSQFRRDVQKELKPLKVQLPRGSFLVFGIVEVIGERAKLSVNVTGAYDPRLNQYVLLAIQPRNLTDWRQVPKGGP